MSVKFSNNATTELASSIGTSDTSITVVDASKFPILTAGDYTYVTLDTDTASPTREIVKVTAISGNVLTVTRGMDGTSPASFAAGTKVELRLTAALLNDVAGANPSGEPIGFPDKSQTTITFDSGTRTFSITPTGASFDVYCKGVKYTYTAVQLVTIPNTTGLHFIYFSASGVLSTQMSYFTWEEHAPTAYVYWNATTQQAIYFADERHGITLDWQTHEYLHRTRGAAIANGFAASGYTTTGLGATDADAQIDIGGGTFFDEDMQVDIVSTNTPVAGTWQQDLSGPARIPVLYLSGSAWVIDAPTNFPFKVVSSVPQYNLYSGGTWSTASVTNNSYFVSWILATNNLTYPVVSIISQAPTNQLSVAEAMTFEGLNLNGFPSVEFRPLYKVIYQYKDGFANSVKSSTIAVYDLRSISSAGVAAALVQDHGNLSGLTDDDHPQYVHTSEVRTPSAAVKNSFFPSQVGQTGKYLSTDGTNTVWEPAPSGSLSFTGDVTGTGSTGSSVSLTLAASGVVAGQYTKVTVDAKGRVTAGTGVTSSDVTTALGYTPYNATNPAGYTTNVGTVTSVSGTGTVSGLTLTGSVTSSGSLTLGGTLSLTSGQVTSALGFTPYNATNPSGYITSSSNITGTAAGITGYTLADVTGTPTTVMTRNSGGDSAVGSRFHFTTCTADGGNFALVGLNWGGAAGTYKDFEVYDYPNSRPLFRAFGSTRNFEVYGTLTAPNFADSTGTYNVNLGSGGSEGRGLVAGYSGGSYGGIGYNVRHTTTGDSYIAPGGDTSSYLRFAGGGFSFLGAAAGSVGRSLSYTTLASISAAGTFNAVNLTNNGNQVLHAGNYGSGYFKTINGSSIIGTGDLTVSGTDNTKLPLTGGTLTGTTTLSSGQFNLSAASQSINTTTPGTTLYSLNFTGQGTPDYAHGITWGWSSSGAQAGVYVQSSGGYGTKMYLATTDSFATGAKTAVSIDHGGNVAIVRGALTQGGNQVLHAGNYSSYALPLSGGTLTGGLGVGAIIGSRGTALSVSGSSNSSAIVAKSSDYATVSSILPHSSSWTYYGTGVYYNNGAWVHASADSNNALFGINGSVGGSWWASSTGTASWNVASGTALWNAAGTWVGSLNAAAGAQVNGSAILSAANYTSYSPSLIGSGASGTWGIRITGFANQGTARLYSTDAAYNYDSGAPYFGYLTYDGSRWLFQVSPATPAAVRVAYADTAGSATAATSAIRLSFNDGPRDLSDRFPNSFARTVNFDFVGAGSGNGTGNYAGVMTFSPWTGTTASTGDSSYQLAFANNSGVNASGQPRLSIRNGIDTTWNAWYTLLHSGNYTSYSPSLTGTGASGTWGINITGSAASAPTAAKSSATTVPASTAFAKWMFATTSTSGTLDWNASSNTFPGVGETLLLGSAANGPGGGNYYHPLNIEYSGNEGNGQITQMAIAYSTPANELYMRGRYAGSWSSWVRYLNSANYTSYTVALSGDQSIAGTKTFTTQIRTNRIEGTDGAFLLRGGANSGTTRHLNLSDSETDPASSGSVVGITWGARTDSNPYYLIYPRYYSNGYSTHNRLVLAWHTGIEIGAASGYGGTRFFNNSPFAGSEIFSVGKGDDNVRVANSLYVQGDSRGQDVYTTGGWFRNHTNNNGIYWSSTGWHLYPYNSGDFYFRSGTNESSIRFTNSSASELGYLHCASDSAMGFLTSGRSWRFRVDNSGNARCYNNLYIDQNYGHGIVGVYSSVRYQGVFAMGDSYKLPADGTGPGNLYGLAWSYPSAGGVAGNLDSHGLLVLINGGLGSAISYSIVAAGNVTAYSDERLKTNWREMPENYVERLAQVKVGIYDRIDGEKITQVGIGAQSFQRLLPEAITKAADEMGTLSVSYGNAAMASAVELAKELVMLKKELAEIKSRLH